MIGYPPRPRLRPASFVFGILTGLVLAVIAAVVIWVMSLDSPRKDPVYEVISVSWGSRLNENDLEPMYQAVVSARQVAGSGYEVSAHIGMGRSYRLTVGILGTAKFKQDAIQKFGTIRWTPDAVTFGSDTAVVASVKRYELDKGR